MYVFLNINDGCISLTMKVLKKGYGTVQGTGTYALRKNSMATKIPRYDPYR
jgi:hypothetical protein